MAYATFGQDMRSTGREAGKAIKGMGKAIAGNAKDPFAMAWPLGQGVAAVLWCCLKMVGYVIRKICD